MCDIPLLKAVQSCVYAMYSCPSPYSCGNISDT